MHAHVVWLSTVAISYGVVGAVFGCGVVLLQVHCAVGIAHVVYPPHQLLCCARQHKHVRQPIHGAWQVHRVHGVTVYWMYAYECDALHCMSGQHNDAHVAMYVLSIMCVYDHYVCASLCIGL